uniref:Putative secreted protein n=1 Tax=Amblyomma tuberculatum TaxID=48802 RepID=A0A6M2E1M7_9ACAR
MRQSIQKKAILVTFVIVVDGLNVAVFLPCLRQCKRGLDSASTCSAVQILCRGMLSNIFMKRNCPLYLIRQLRSFKLCGLDRTFSRKKFFPALFKNISEVLLY